MKKYVGIFAIAIMTFTSTQTANSIDGVGFVDSPAPASYTMDKCELPTSMNCIESVGLVGEDGTYYDAELKNYDSINTVVDPNGNTHFYSNANWVAKGTTIRVYASLDSINSIIWKNSDTDIQYGAAMRILINVPNPLDTKVRIKARTSWLRPQSVQLKMYESDFQDEKIPGGHRWTFEGKGLPYSSFNGSTSQALAAGKENADYDGILFDIFMHHAGIDAKHSFWPPICADQGFTVQSNNTNETGEPSWDVKEQTLQFGVLAPHFTSTGKLNTGYFKFWTTDNFLNCKFPGNTLTKSPKLEVQILDDKGAQLVATTQVSHADGKIILVASGFHFSSPRIVLRAANTSPLTLIKCKKSKTLKVVTGRKPVCPTGYKKVK
ncbi:MAG: hypothetical protein ACKOVI_04360 [Candidatus Planktophila sp.]